MKENQLIDVAMSMILDAGDARNSICEALDAIIEEDKKTADEKIAESKKYIEEAHRIQTQIIQKEAAGEPFEYSMLFAHAQDTLMTIYSEYHIAVKMIAMYDKLNRKINQS